MSEVPVRRVVAVIELQAGAFDGDDVGAVDVRSDIALAIEGAERSRLFAEAVVYATLGELQLDVADGHAVVPGPALSLEDRLDALIAEGLEFGTAAAAFERVGQ